MGSAVKFLNLIYLSILLLVKKISLFVALNLREKEEGTEPTWRVLRSILTSPAVLPLQTYLLYPHARPLQRLGAKCQRLCVKIDSEVFYCPWCTASDWACTCMYTHTYFHGSAILRKRQRSRRPFVRGMRQQLPRCAGVADPLEAKQRHSLKLCRL